MLTSETWQADLNWTAVFKTLVHASFPESVPHQRVTRDRDMCLCRLGWWDWNLPENGGFIYMCIHVHSCVDKICICRWSVVSIDCAWYMQTVNYIRLLENLCFSGLLFFTSLRSVAASLGTFSRMLGLSFPFRWAEFTGRIRGVRWWMSRHCSQSVSPEKDPPILSESVSAAHALSQVRKHTDGYVCEEPGPYSIQREGRIPGIVNITCNVSCHVT